MKRSITAAFAVVGLGLAITAAAVQPSNGQPSNGQTSNGQPSSGQTSNGLSLSSQASAPSHTQPGKDKKALHFDLERSSGVVAGDCLEDAGAKVTVKRAGQVEKMTIKAHDLVPNSEYDVFIIQVPNAPFGVSWYQGDLESDRYGDAVGHYTGRFSIETFAVAPGSAPNAQVFDGDGSDSVASPPIHEYHVGVWFGSPKTAVKAGCPDTVTPFNGEHDAGIQALSTKQFDDLDGPLRELD